MALSDIDRRTSRSDLRGRLASYTQEDLADGELNQWLNLGVYDVFVRLSTISDIWYGTSKAISLTASGSTTGAVTEVALSGIYAPTKIAKIIKLIMADGRNIPFYEDKVIHSLLDSSHHDNAYGVSWFGESLFVFVGKDATDLAANSGKLYFVRKPDRMTADTGVWSTILSSVVATNYLDVSYGGVTIRFTCTTDGATVDSGHTADQKALFAVGGTDTLTAVNLKAAINNVFQNQVTADNSTATLTVTGAAAISGSATFTTITEATPAYVDVPSEFVDLVIMSAMSKAMVKLNMLGQKQQIDSDIVSRFNDIRQAYSSEIQIGQAEKQPGVQTPRQR